MWFDLKMKQENYYCLLLKNVKRLINKLMQNLETHFNSKLLNPANLFHLDHLLTSVLTLTG